MRQPEVPLARCVRCEKHKPASDFGRDPHKTNKLKSWCRQCFTDEARERRRAKNGGRVRDRRVRADGYVWCPRCADFLPPDRFNRTSEFRHGFYPHCRGCCQKRKGGRTPEQRARYAARRRVRYREILAERQRQFQLDFFGKLRPDFFRARATWRSVLGAYAAEWEASELAFEREAMADLAYLSFTHRWDGRGVE